MKEKGHWEQKQEVRSLDTNFISVPFILREAFTGHFIGFYHSEDSDLMDINIKFFQ